MDKAEIPKVRDIIKSRSTSFREQTQPLAYDVNRGLESRKPQSLVDKNSTVNIEGYVDILPKFDGKDIKAIIEERIQSYGKAEILDVGCGQGRFLADCKRLWGDKIQSWGLTSYPYHDIPVEGVHPNNKDLGKTTDSLKQLGIQVVRGDAHGLTHYFRPGMFDVVTSVKTARYLIDPLAMMKGVYRVLKSGGVALINDLPLRIDPPEDVDKLIDYLRDKYKWSVDAPTLPTDIRYQIAFAKTDDRLVLPVEHDKVIEHPNLGAHYQYRLTLN